MIRLEAMKARLHCDDEGCTESIRVALVLLPTGALAPVVPPEAHGRWQLFIDQQNPTKPYTGRCPSHKTDAPRILTAH